MQPEAIDELMSIISGMRISARHCKLFWIWMRPMIRFTDIKKDGSFTATMTAICRCIASAVSFC
jgi:hypothetical protein